jgi:hypothetical protein
LLRIPSARLGFGSGVLMPRDTGRDGRPDGTPQGNVATYRSEGVVAAAWLELLRFWSWLKAHPLFSYRQWPYIRTFRHRVSLLSAKAAAWSAPSGGARVWGQRVYLESLVSATSRPGGGDRWRHSATSPWSLTRVFGLRWTPLEAGSSTSGRRGRQ